MLSKHLLVALLFTSPLPIQAMDEPSEVRRDSISLNYTHAQMKSAIAEGSFLDDNTYETLSKQVPPPFSQWLSHMIEETQAQYMYAEDKILKEIAVLFCIRSYNSIKALSKILLRCPVNLTTVIVDILSTPVDSLQRTRKVTSYQVDNYDDSSSHEWAYDWGWSDSD